MTNVPGAPLLWAACSFAIALGCAADDTGTPAQTFAPSPGGLGDERADSGAGDPATDQPAAEIADPADQTSEPSSGAPSGSAARGDASAVPEGLGPTPPDDADGMGSTPTGDVPEAGAAAPGTAPPSPDARAPDGSAASPITPDDAAVNPTPTPSPAPPTVLDLGDPCTASEQCSARSDLGCFAPFESRPIGTPPDFACETDVDCAIGKVCVRTAESAACWDPCQATGCPLQFPAASGAIGGTGGKALYCADNGLCEPLACTSDDQCPANFSCTTGLCERALCASDQDCVDGGPCVKGSCHEQPGACDYATAG